MKWNEKTILVTGSKGFLGSFIVKELEKLCPKKIITPSAKELDLRDISNCKKAVQDVDIIFHLAAHVGGIGLNMERPGDLFYDNLMMGTQLLHEAKNASIQKFIALGTVCSYPKFSQIPFLESSIWDGYPDETNAPYGLAKKMMLVQSQAYRKQYDFKSIVVIPTNIYGPCDNFEPSRSHVIPALILKIGNAKKNNLNSITLWGDGSPTRDFLYVEDAANGIILAADKYDDFLPVNLSSEEEISIKQLAEMISDLMKFDGKIIWDSSKPNGQPRRCVSNQRAKESFGFEPKITLNIGLQKTIDWYNANIN
jgi:GDP-L-fucose synthase|tara:strand:+ start:1329 stop:2258 length:930 start_codon:yes stop_codon:yes gene_type:complete